MPESIRDHRRCPHGISVYNECPTCEQEIRDWWEAHLLSELDPDHDTWVSDFVDWLEDPDRILAQCGDRVVFVPHPATSHQEPQS